jgi:hypothetical protein
MTVAKDSHKWRWTVMHNDTPLTKGKKLSKAKRLLRQYQAGYPGQSFLLQSDMMS